MPLLRRDRRVAACASAGGMAGPIGQSGLDHAPVSRFRALDSEKDMPIDATCGPLFTISSPSAALQRSLESRLRARMDASGSPLYALTWKSVDMPAGVPILQRRALVRRTSGNGSSGWPAPNVPTGGQGTGHAERKGATYRNKEGKKVQLSLQAAAKLAGWPTPKEQNSRGASIKGDGLSDIAKLAGWATPRVSDLAAGRILNAKGQRVSPSGVYGANLSDQVLGPTSTSSHALTKKRGALNPNHSRWLMGFPLDFGTSARHSVDWLLWQALMAPVSAEQRAIGLRLLGATATRSYRK